MRTRLLLPLAGLALMLATACTDDARRPTAPEAVRTQAPGLDGLFAQSQNAARRIRVILRHPDMASQRAVAAAARAQGVPVLHQYRRFPFTAMKVSENALQGLLRSGRVVSWAEDIPEPPALNSALPVINGDDVHGMGYDGSGQVVAILDTGIDPDHGFLGGRVVAERCFSTPDPDMYDDTSLCPNGETTDDAANIDVDACLDDDGENMCSHGTHVAGIAAGYGVGVAGAPDAGVAPGADIIAIQVFTRFDGAGECGFLRTPPCVLAYASDQLAALEEVLILGSTYPIAAANMSLGGGVFGAPCDDDPDYEARAVAVEALLAEGIATVIAAGNNGFDKSVSGPGCISSAVTVGGTNDDDEVKDPDNDWERGFNRGPLLDLFAPGIDIVSSVADNGYDEYDGTSMATPMVTGAYAVLRSIVPYATVEQILTLLQETGVDITYNDGEDVTPRIDLLAAVEAALTGFPPTVTVDEETVTVDEGSTAANTGTFSDPEDDAVVVTASVGAVSQDDAAGTWSWSFETTDGPAESQTVTVTAVDATGKADDVSFELVVNNVAPTVTIATDQVTSVLEGSTLLVKADFGDPGVDDGPFTAVVTCSDIGGWPNETVSGTVTITDAAALEGGVTAPCDYGDTSESGDPPAGTFAVSVAVTDKDGGEGSDGFDLEVENAAPTPVIDVSGATLVNGVPTFIAQAGDVLAFDGDVTDPGSDDLFVDWDWADGATDEATSLLAPPDPDPFPSPDVDPRNETFSASHAWTDACVYAVSFAATDDDGGEGSDGAVVLIAGTSGRARSAGYWQPQYRGKRPGGLDDATLGCYLEIAGQMSAVFDEVVDASTPQAAGAVLHPTGRSDMTELLDMQLLAAGLNFANGAFLWDEAVDTDGDGVPDTPFSTAVTTAEAVRLDPASTLYELEAQKDVLESINLMDGG